MHNEGEKRVIMPELQEGQIVAPAAIDSDNGTEIVNPDHSYSWEASEYVFHQKGAKWYMLLFGVAGALEAVLVILQQWLSVTVVAVMTLAVVVYSRKAPRVLQYHLDEHGITINGKLNPYNDFRSYSVIEDVGWQSIDLEPAKRLVPRLTILAEHDNFEAIESILSAHLPQINRRPDWIERLTRYFKF
jgi:hypothetical protein